MLESSALSKEVSFDCSQANILRSKMLVLIMIETDVNVQVTHSLAKSIDTNVIASRPKAFKFMFKD